jgi:hypothetical protein
MRNCAAPRADECASRFLLIRRPGSSPRTHRHGPKLVLPSQTRCGSFPLRRLKRPNASTAIHHTSLDRKQTFSAESGQTASPPLFRPQLGSAPFWSRVFHWCHCALPTCGPQIAPRTSPPDSPAFRPPHFASRTASQTPRIVSLHSGGSKTGRDRRTCFFTFQTEVTTASVRPSDPNTKLAEITS